MATRRPWGLTEALSLITKLRPDLAEAGWSVGLHGSVLYAGASRHDLDLLFYPLDSSRNTTEDSLRDVLSGHGLTLRFSAEQVKEIWRRKNSKDEKHVEVWLFEGRRIDVFIMR